MKITFPLKAEFKTWLIESAGLIEKSAESYLSYVSGVNKLILISTNNKQLNLFTVLQTNFENNNYISIGKTIDYLLEELTRENAVSFFDRPLGTLQNYKTGLRKYLEFIQEQTIYIESDIEENDKSPKNEEIQYLNDKKIPLTENNSDYIYDKSELRTIFLSRLTTQDRVYDNIFYPIRFINYLFSLRNKRKVFIEWADDLISSTNILLKESEISLKDINSLRISVSNNKVYVTTKGKEEIVYTTLPNNEQEILKVSKIREIHLDHINSLESTINKNHKDNYPTISKITEELKTNHISASTNSDILKKLKELSKLKLLKDSKQLSIFIETVNIQKLRDELDSITSITHGFQLMYGSHNIRKGKNNLI